MLDLTQTEHDALNRLARYGSLPLGQGPDRVPTSAAIRLNMVGCITLTIRGGEQFAEITRQGRAFRNRVAA